MGNLMADKTTLDVIDRTLQSVEENFKQFIEVLEKAKNELINLEKEKERLSHDKESLETEKIQLEQDKTKLENDKLKLENETRKLAIEKQERDQKIGSMTEEQKRLLKEYEKVKVELSKFAKIAEEAESHELNFDRIQALLSIFRVLVEKIWQGQPHYRILMTLHGDKEKMTRDELKNTTGIGGAYILRAVQELANVDLVVHDIDTATVKLKQRLYSKEALEDK
jgi:chromosome segregation ATPase